MKYRNFITKVLCFILVFAAFVPYQAKAARKAEEEAENAAKIAEVEAANREVRKQMADAENASPYTDGVYEGTAEGFGGPVSVEVTIELQTQGVDVDTISGATFTSKGLIHAVTEALRKARR